MALPRRDTLADTGTAFRREIEDACLLERTAISFGAVCRRPMTEAELDEAAREFEAAIIEWLREVEQELDRPALAE